VPLAPRKEIFRWQLVANREVSGLPEVAESLLAHHIYPLRLE